MVDTDEDKFRAFFLAAYFADSLECLQHEMKAKLVHIVDQLGFQDSWQETVELDFGISREWVRDAFRVLTAVRPPSMALQFLMRGFECDDIDEHLALVFGHPAEVDDRTKNFQWEAE